ncbi:MAG: thioredoxin [Rubinisphaera brasiliensis]|uniref:Thioredoxin n=2 Tax=Rubinisphaera brasiliensis TaxID=119 RepID=F0SFR8_RUBBR|nr:thioredoxin [Rubinisphaera sp. JC750]ADY61525.1 thioredoxin [Rubinisphaera brasiliensis DSM 5305]MBR9803384.1 thioredoxin [bacterium]
MAVKHANDSTFSQAVLQSNVPVLVDFHADWCPPCRMMDSTVNEIADELGPNADVVKVNVDDAQETAASYGIRSIPTFAVVHNGQVQTQLTGVVPKDQLLTELQRFTTM